MIKLRDIIIPAYYEAHKDIKERKHTHYWFKGGRGSTKSSFISIEIIYNIIKDSECNAICFRKIGKDIEESVYNQILWAIDILGVNQYFKAYKSPYRIVYMPTGQVITFRGLDDATKTKSIKLKNGYYKISWFEELDEFAGLEEIRKAEQSIMRGGNEFIAFKSYNPPQNVNSWVNKEVQHDRADRLIIHNSYLDVPPEWLGEQFFIEAEYLKKLNELSYRHEYLGEVTGTGGLIFQNAKDIRLTDEEIKRFDNVREGIDWGFACLKGDTLVATDKGNRPIKNIKIGDNVLTREGYKKVLFTQNKGIKEVYSIDFGYGCIIATGDHRIYTKDGWKRVDELNEYETICLTKLNTEKHALKSVHIKRQLLKEKEEVFDITVENGEFFANGILVHNCDPFAWNKLHYDKTRRCIYIYDEIHKTGLTNARAIELIKPKTQVAICADSAEPKSIAEFQVNNVQIFGAKKGVDSVRYGIKWLQNLTAIYIDKVRCPHTFDEFTLYELEKDKNGEFKDKYPDKNNHCLVESTLVATSRGDIPIKDVKIGDFVLTRKGYKRVLWSGISARNVQTYTLVTQKGLKLTGTFNHKIYTNTGFRDIIALRYGDELLTINGYKKWLKEKQLNTTVKFGTGTQKQKEVAIEITSKNVENFYITTFGKNTMGYVKKAITFIIKMVILPIIILKILKKLQQKNTSGLSTPLMNSDCNFKKNILTISESSQKNGTLQQKDTNGIRNTLKNVILDILRMGKKNVKFAARCLKLKQSIRNFVQTSANQNTEDCVNSTKLQKTVNGAGQNLEQINTVKPVFVPDNVKIIQCGKIENQVYDLTVEDCHEFFANGILVHNCIDAIRYALESDMNSYNTKVIGMRPF